MATGIKEIAKRANVHPSTVSLALNGSKRVSEKVRDEIKEIAEQIHYRPNYMAKGLAGQRTQTIGIILPKLKDLYVVEAVASQEEWLRENNYASLISITHMIDTNEEKALEDLLGRGVDGLVFDYVPSSRSVLNKLASLASKGIILSFMGTTGLEGVDEATWDMSRGGYELTRYLLQLGHKRIAFVGWGSSDRKRPGYLKALEEASIDADSSLMFECNYAHSDVSWLRKEIMSLKKRPTAIFAYNDDLAAELIRELILDGYQIPEEISIVSVNDGWYSAMLKVPLTTYRISPSEIAVAAVRMLVERIQKPDIAARRYLAQGTLVIRDSACPVMAQ